MDNRKYQRFNFGEPCMLSRLQGKGAGKQFKGTYLLILDFVISANFVSKVI